ncbi:MAG: hypothetical protein ACD_69C00073G0004, partial [uncultured bacterium]
RQYHLLGKKYHKNDDSALKLSIIRETFKTYGLGVSYG